MSTPGFWEDRARAETTGRRLTGFKEKLAIHRELEERLTEVREFWQLALAEDDNSLEADIERELAAAEDRV